MTLSAALLSAFFAPFHLGAKVMYAPFHTSFAAASDVSEIAVGSVRVIYIRSSLKEPFCWFTRQVLLFLFLLNQPFREVVLTSAPLHSRKRRNNIQILHV